MSSGDDKLLSRSGSVEVVADQAQDGSFEIRVGHDDAGAPAVSAPPVEDSSTSWQAVEDARSTDTPNRLVVGAIALIGAIIVIALGVKLLSTPTHASRPETVAVREAPEFRGFVISGQAPARARSVELNFAADDEADATPDWEAPAENHPDNEVNAGAIRTRGDAVGAQAPTVGATPRSALSAEERRAEALEELRIAIEGDRARRAASRAEREAAEAEAEAEAHAEAEEEIEEVEEDEYYDEEYDEDEEVYDEYEE